MGYPNVRLEFRYEQLEVGNGQNTTRKKNFFAKKSQRVSFSIYYPVDPFYIEIGTFFIPKWSAKNSLQTLKVWNDSEMVTVTVVETPWNNRVEGSELRIS